MARDDNNISFRSTFGNIHALLVLDRNDYSDTKQDFVNTMWNLHNNITNIAILYKQPLIRWLTSFAILIPKDAKQPKMYILRIINIYESNYNLVLKFFWPKTWTENTEKNKWLKHNQTRGRKEMSSIKMATKWTNNRMPPTYAQTNVHAPGWCSIGCFDRIIMNHTILNNRKFYIPSNIYTIYHDIQDKMKYTTQINNIISKVSYTRTNKYKLHGVW